MTTNIQSNGSRWAGEAPATVDELLDVLATHALRREMYRDEDFTQEGEEIERITGLPGCVRFCGNFFNLSHVFSIDTDEPKLIARLRAAIDANKLRPDYIAQAPFFDRNLVSVEPVRFSETQGEAKLFYDGELLGQFGDEYRPNNRGQWEGHPPRYWDDAARKLMAERHAASLEAAS